jgi:hypothetical protein
VPVSGAVITTSGEACDGALVVFHPRDAGRENDAKPVATTDAEGRFELTTFAEGDGALPGEYGVTIVWNKPAEEGKISLFGDEGSAPGGQDRLGGRYGIPKSPKLEATVTPDGENEFRFEVEL